VATACELVRVVHVGEGCLAVGTGLKGRGAWLCRDAPGCLELADRRGAFSRALRRPIPQAAVAGLRAELYAGSANRPREPEKAPGPTRGRRS
jgi:predicted RNA-binding protein YlxR (DUF448 family)